MQKHLCVLSFSLLSLSKQFDIVIGNRAWGLEVTFLGQSHTVVQIFLLNGRGGQGLKSNLFCVSRLRMYLIRTKVPFGLGKSGVWFGTIFLNLSEP